MLKQIALIIFILSAAGITSLAQMKTRLQKLVSPAKVKEFFALHPQLKEVHFRHHVPFGQPALEFIENTEPVFQAANRFELDNAGDVYFLRKRFPKVPFADSLFRRFINKKAVSADLTGLIRPDSMFLTIEEYFPAKKQSEEEMVFEKVELRVDYKKGLHVLAKELQDSVKDISGDKDPVVVLRGIVHPDGKFLIDKVVTGNNQSPYVKTLISLIHSSGPWVPYEACGRKVKAYKQIYLKLHPDSSYTIAMD